MRNGPGKISEPGREKDEERMKNEEDSLAQSDRCKIVNKGIRPPFVYMQRIQEFLCRSICTPHTRTGASLFAKRVNRVDVGHQ